MWYRSGLRFECTRCGDCCRGEPGFVWVRPSDITRIAKFLELDRKDFVRRHVRTVGSRYSLNEKPGGDCIFWEDTCRIYPVRPPQCRSFPFWRDNLESPEDWEYVAERCPGVDKGTTHQVADMGTADAFEELARIYAQVDEEAERMGASCDACGRCCNFREADHDLFATRLEVYYIVSRAGMPPRPVEDGICPYLEGETCAVHEYRTLGCRAFYCKDGMKDYYQPLYEKYRRIIGKLSANYYLSEDYGCANDILRELTR